MKLLRLGLAVALLSVLPGTTNAATATAPERQIMDDVNAARADRGLAPLRSDWRLWVLADQRASAMASADVLSHGVAGSLQAGLDARDIQWYRHGEVVAFSTASGSAGAAHLFDLWASSPAHWALLVSGSFNYLGVGTARSGSGRTYGSIVLTESKDRTGARGTMVSATVVGDDVRWTWRGADPLLQTHTAGLRDFAVQQRTDKGTWVTVSAATTNTSRTAVNRSGGHWYGLRVRARDRAGNVGPWSAERRVWVP
jgi:uncharacterized protein YkwD